jgi:hypothetical protein
VAIDQQKVGLVAARLMESLETKYGEDARLETVALLVTVDHGDQTSVEFALSEATPPHVAIGLLEYVSRNLG